MIIYPLFASNVFVGSINEDLKELQKIKKYDFIETKEDMSSGSYITKNQKILNDFPKVKNVIQKNFNEVKNEVLMHRDTNFEITTSWGTKVLKDSFCQFHSHMNCLYSGILYFDEYDLDSGTLEFESPFITQQIYAIPSEYNIVNARVYGFKPKKNNLIFFPSYLRHRITKHLSKIERYSLSFNLMPVGKLGRGDSYIDIVLKS